jgi:AbiV family abortive infection protein
VTSKKLKAVQVHGVGIAALDNALAVMADASVLLMSGRPLRAYALGLIAAEEYAKSFICRLFLESWTGTLTVSDLQRALRPKGGAHALRYAQALTYLDAMSAGELGRSLGNLNAVAKSDMRDRERVLYVGVNNSGAPTTPADVSEKQARLWLEGMAGWFLQLAGVWRTALDDALTAP